MGVRPPKLAEAAILVPPHTVRTANPCPSLTINTFRSANNGAIAVHEYDTSAIEPYIIKRRVRVYRTSVPFKAGIWSRSTPTTLANVEILARVASITPRMAETGGVPLRDIESNRSNALMRAVIRPLAGSRTFEKRLATRSETAKTRYWRRAECSCESAKRIPRMASTQRRREGGIALDMLDTGSVDKRRKYELRESSTSGPS
jgi:hypothetical protein